MADPWSSFFIVSLIVLGVLMLLCALRAVIGPRTADRLIAVNMITTLVTICICILTLFLEEDYLADVALLFSLLGFLSVVVLTRILPARKSGLTDRPSKEAPHAG